MELKVTNSPFNQEQSEKLNQVFATLTNEQKVWLSGYLSASAIQANASDVTQATTATGVSSEPKLSKRAITVLFGSETGNAQGLAETLESKLKEKDFDVTIACMEDFKPKDLKKVEDLFIVTATHGEGDPPDNAITFHEFLHSRKAPKLNDLRYSVLALGDESYEFFCQTGKDFDKRLEELGAERLIPRVDCDLDFDEPAEKWMTEILETIGQASSQASTEQAQASAEDVSATQTYSRSNPFEAEILENIKLNGRGSNKEVRHIELSLEGFNEAFEPGDCIGIFPKNDPAVVSELINTLVWKPDESVVINDKGDTLPLEEALTSHFEITKLTKSIVTKAADIFGNGVLSEKVKKDRWIYGYVEGRDLIDLINDFPPEDLQTDALHQILRKLPAREYSIASSHQATPDEVHLTIGAVRYHAHDRDRNGVCSVQFAERLQPGDTVPLYLKKNPNFKFPKTNETPVIMIGPGTGVAPFRSYIQEKEELDLNNKAWLFFGEQHFTTDFLYQTEWQGWLKDGVLDKLSVAFSRDSEEKVYVQHRIEENSKEFYQWIQEGAAIYICGDEKCMAKDVHQAILNVIQTEGHYNEEEAEAFLTQLKKDRRYQRDIY
ncbi:assimilatory sulfite reductase (NADPH) flavoprotein subunit [Mammaliicoccus sp. Dog046]|uniref:assimilatory sulfite reductase (NADPH) flavoprotein subunit n=1 Tax=Mammaliicoccus sp. Dog046 TaxID=3034233 RepID=UPI002B25EFC6|nr:assimilatory sulfite reductase (NADPH) flavoprotein subunit [Mammaliicoccus sp. Dog046]WQK85685.1 assimilatory sulfite reductase (NADPH) flavoprotein subunit [Mammaliicoccus sp. Dog046]